MEKDDVELIHNILSGDETAFNALVEKYQKSIHAIAWQRVGDFHVAEEITQDVFLQAYNKLSTLKAPNKFARWLYVITKRRCANWLQRGKPILQSLEATDRATLEKSAFANYVAEQREKAATEHRREIVNRLLDKLPERERTVVTLYYLGEMTSEAISKFLGVSVNTIKSRLRRARQRLREEKMITVECYEQDKFKGKKITILQDIEDLQDSLERSGFENRISSIRIIQEGDFPRNGGKVVLHEHPDFAGIFLPIHIKPEISMIEIPNYPHSIHSIKIEG
ncbi:MAG: sigma-70 family RNA polymerase sigma factor [Candidatus Poribacteria bacterium]|nr:sigma-70 family RNA polymerase sigma factor [Candidatus Poribacteria bacterium]